MKFTRLAASAAIAAILLPAAAFAQVAAGAKVYGPQGNEVGTIVKVEGGIVTLDTGAHKAPLPEDAFGKGDNGPTITVTKAQIDAMMDEQVAAAKAARDNALLAGAAVVTAKGAPAGTIKSVEGDAVVLESPTGPVALKREHFAVNPQGALMALFTADQIAAATDSGETSE
ncbi:hypothetical protein A6F68_01590 [Tsuneonella dongtanensis]|uniref:PRC-barrel domain protein n=1 Tax=Tsuneonella dongtanensis TaxID=692370 RepID=A0A1B2AD81_9SPHN|nr:hypothetical protein [Tsuneonella dongtanensis]ANY20103.1 hypothetical protein A6F68_01590 [Tsuneonella dongtanensis]